MVSLRFTIEQSARLSVRSECSIVNLVHENQSMSCSRLILGSQSDQRRRLLESITQPSAVSVLPPTSADEPGFDGLHTVSEIEERLNLVVQMKTDDVCLQLESLARSAATTHESSSVVICADTVVVCVDSQGRQIVLGKPPLMEWEDTVRFWFRTYYSDQIHEVWTGFQLTSDDQSRFQIVKSKVAFPVISDDWIDWYLSTNEPIGKAGGYGIQGHAAAFVKSINGSLTTIIGLPVWELRQMLVEHFEH